MTEKINVDVDVGLAMALLRGLKKSAMQEAWRRTLRKTSKWVIGQAAKAASAKTRIPQRVLKSRIRYYLKDQNTGKVWVGLSPLAADRIGKARQTKTGVSIAKHRFPKAWIMKPAGKAVFERIGKRRLPIKRVMVDWSGDGEAALRSVVPAIQQRLIEILTQEVNYEILKAKGNA